jgi:hypothetical protein
MALTNVKDESSSRSEYVEMLAACVVYTCRPQSIVFFAELFPYVMSSSDLVPTAAGADPFVQTRGRKIDDGMGRSLHVQVLGNSLFPFVAKIYTEDVCSVLL